MAHQPSWAILLQSFTCKRNEVKLFKLKLGDKESARGVMVIVVGNGHGDTSSNPGPSWLDLERYESNYSPYSYGLSVN